MGNSAFGRPKPKSQLNKQVSKLHKQTKNTTHQSVSNQYPISTQSVPGRKTQQNMAEISVKKNHVLKQNKKPNGTVATAVVRLSHFQVLMYPEILRMIKNEAREHCSTQSVAFTLP